MSPSRWEVLDGFRVQPFVLEPGSTVPTRAMQRRLPPWEQAAAELPALEWEGHPEVEAAFTRAWELAWMHLREPVEGGPFAGVFLDSAFNGNVFLWDAAFAQRFMVYARRVLDAQLLDGFYAAQLEDGWICRTMTPDGRRVWERHDPSSTGPNVLAWIELECAERTGDVARLAHVLPALIAYHRWCRRYRRWPSGGYWSSGWGCGMDGLPRLPEGVDPNFEHGGVTWVDATLQALLSAKSILRAAELTGFGEPLDDVATEVDTLETLVATRLWDAELPAFVDLAPDGTSMGTLHVGTYWSLLAAELDPQQRDTLVAHLTDPAHFGRPFPVPALAASHPAYREDGGYWLGGVWTPTTVMVLDGLRAVGADELAHELGRRHLELVAQVARDTGTIWENYSPERPLPGNEARPDFVGWGGASVITVGLEQVVGLRTSEGRVRWDVRLLERHGVRRLPVGSDATVDLLVAARTHADEEPVLTARTDRPVTIEIQWAGGSRTVALEPEDSLAQL
jgi:glycogen debranching enzyme